MKTSLNIGDDLLMRAKKLAQKRKTTVRQLIEEGLRKVLREAALRKDKATPKLITFGGDGLTDEFRSRGLAWSELRKEVYPQ